MPSQRQPSVGKLTGSLLRIVMRHQKQGTGALRTGSGSGDHSKIDLGGTALALNELDLAFRRYLTSRLYRALRGSSHLN